TGIAELRTAVESDNESQIATATANLQEAAYKLSQRLYENNAANPTGGDASANPDTTQAYNAADFEGEPSGGAAKNANDDVIDAEFKETK
ncbi:MAG: hypothetical protein H7Y38_12980, partial [Armatimonadetes bacterium]|nr:hypothetical protein [Armatimonadota bacterium]